MGHSLQGRYYYRCYSLASAGGLACGKYLDISNGLSHRELLHEFGNHRNRAQKVPTALISVTTRPLEAIYRALAKYCTPCDGVREDPEEIWIATMFVPDDAKVKPHHAYKLAQRFTKDENHNALFKYEWLFEQEIPKDYVKHIVSLQRLLKHGPSVESFLDTQDNFPNSLRDMKTMIVSELTDADMDFYGTGCWFGSIARAFGVGAPMYEIAKQVVSDFFEGLSWVDGENQYVWLRWVDGKGKVESHGFIEFSSICLIEQGIRDELDAWLGN